jgi:N-acetylmuramoyl-L-alanine amidase
VALKLLAAGAVLLSSRCALADTLIVAGQQIRCPAPLVVEGQEILAPLLSGLGAIGGRVESKGNEAVIHTAAGKTIVLREGNRRALLDGEPLALPCPPRRMGGELYVPVKALAKTLGVLVRWQGPARPGAEAKLSVIPWLKPITLDQRGKTVAVKVSASAPIRFSFGQLKDPPRLYLDIADVALEVAEQQVQVNLGNVVAVRAAQYSADPAIARIVFDLKELAEYPVQTDEKSMSLAVLIPVSEGKEGSAAAGVAGVRIEGRARGTAEIFIDGTAANPVTGRVVEGGDGAAKAGPSRPRVVVELDNLRASDGFLLPRGNHPLIQTVSFDKAPSAEGGSARLVVELTKRCRHLLMRAGAGLHLMLGSLSLEDLTVAIDPGHGGNQPGALGSSGLMEKDVNLDVALRLKEILEQTGVTPLLTRSDDNTTLPIMNRGELASELRNRTRIANEAGADLFVSIHCNSSPRRNTRSGTETYYCTSWSRPLAEALQASLLATLGRADGGIRNEPFVVVKETQMPSVLLELAYLNHPEEEKLLGQPQFRQLAAQAIAAGLRKFVEEGGLLEGALLKLGSRAKQKLGIDAPVSGQRGLPSRGGKRR